MAGSHLLDTNTVIALLEKDRAVSRRLPQAPAVAVPSKVGSHVSRPCSEREAASG
jgi:hypothetical protein